MYLLLAKKTPDSFTYSIIALWKIIYKNHSIILAVYVIKLYNVYFRKWNLYFILHMIYFFYENL